MNKIAVTKALKGVKFGGGSCPEYTLDIPEGLKVRSVPDREGVFWVDEFTPWEDRPEHSMMLHDAKTRGIRLTSDQVTELNQFWFNTGVRPESGSPLYADQQWRDGTKQIPFYADAPQNALHIFLCDDPNRPEAKYDGWIVRPIYNTSILSLYCYFRLPKEA